MTPYTKKIVELHKIHKAIEDCGCNKDDEQGGGNEITIDDVVKFIHDDFENAFPGMFPYTTWDSIPNYDDAEDGTLCKSSNEGDNFDSFVLNISSYIIGYKNEFGGK